MPLDNDPPAPSEKLSGLITALVVAVGEPMKIIDSEAYGAMARPLVERPWWLELVSAALAGWLMGLLSWLVSACRDTISQIVIVGLIATSIGLTRLPHAIVGTAEVLSDIFSGGETRWAEFGRFLVLTTIGNGLGGAIFVAVLKHGLSTRSAEDS
jgi:formate/nitrite transporter FocA (FNT family)